MRTEEKAKELWCPWSKPEAGDGRTCIASKCMAWRWGENAHWDRTDGLTPESIGAKTIRRGYCGLAGKPEA